MYIIQHNFKKLVSLAILLLIIILWGNHAYSQTTVTAFSPTKVAVGGTVVITGTNFTGATSVKFGTASNGTGGTAAASFTVNSGTQITAVVNTGTVTGSGYVAVTNSGTGTKSGLSIVTAPTVTTCSPTSGVPGSSVTITGTGLTNLGTSLVSSVTCGGVSATIGTVTASSIPITVGASASGTGVITVVAAGLTLTTSSSFACTAITGFSPTSAGQDSIITITGTNLVNISSIKFGTSSVGAGGTTAIITDSSGKPTQIKAKVASGTTTGSGYISLTSTTPVGTTTFSGFTFLPSPTVSSFTPTSAGTDSSVVITGTNYSGVTGVFFGGTAAKSFTVNSSTQITAVVNTGTSGSVSVVTSGGTGTKTGFTYLPSPTISSFTPTSAGTDSSVVITGTNFSGVTGVTFGGTAAKSFTVYSVTQITAVVNTGTTGSISVVTTGGTGVKAGFTYLPSPTVSSFTPTSAGTDSTVVITGTVFTGVTGVSFGGTAAKSYVVNSTTQITAVVNSGTSGSVSVVTAGGTGTKSGFTYLPSPTISTFTPTSAGTDSSVVITGTNFSGVTGVSFGGTAAKSYLVNSSTQITAVVNTGTSGSISVVTTGGSTSHSGFTYLPSPTISSFTPTSAGTDSSVVITGTNFSGVTSVLFGGTTSKSFVVNSSTQITAVVNTGTSGSVSVVTSGGTGTKSGFTYLPGPTISSFTPTSTGTDSSVVITGTNFSGVTGVFFGGTAAQSYIVNSSTQITAVVSSGTSGSISVVTSGGTGTMSGFTFLPSPTISSFTPTSAGTDSSVVITGTNFSSVTGVSFGGTAAKSFIVNSSTQITAVVNTGTSGTVSVVTAGGSTSLAGFTYLPSPTVSLISPTYTYSGGSVIITGTNFNSVTNVYFGGIAASSYTVNSSTQITATVGSGTSGNVDVITTGGTGTLTSAFTFISAPTVSSFTPTSASTGATVTITGSGFMTGAVPLVSAVSFGGTAASSYTVINATTIDAVVAAGTSGSVSVTTIAGTDSHSGFTYLSLPVISSLSTSTAFGGDTITITGSNFSGATDVQFGGISAVGYSVASGTSITAAVPSGVVGATVVTIISPAGTSNTFSITINNKWTGVTSNDWSVPTNWTAGSVPFTELAVIPSGITPNPVLSTDTYIYDLINNGTLSINGHTLFMETSSGGSGTFIGSPTSILQMDCSDTLYFSIGGNSLLHLIVNNKVSLGNSLNLYGVLYSITDTLTTNGYLTLKNTSSSQNAMVAAVGGSISGTVITERYIPQHVFRPFIDICPIVANAGSVFNNWQEGGVYNNGYGIHITGIKDTTHTQNWVTSKGFDASYSGNFSMQTFPGGVWTNPTNTKTMNLDPAMGYRLLARGNRSFNLYTTPQPTGMNSDVTLRTTGNLITGDVTFSTGGTSSTGGFSSGYGLTSGLGKFSFIGNPYASTVSWGSIVSHGSTQGIQSYYYFLDPNVRDGSNASTYVNYNSVSATNSNGSSSIGDDIQPGMAIFVQQDGSGTSPQILFQETDKTAGNTPLTVFGTKTPVNKLGINLWKGGRSIDGAVAVFKAGFTKGIGKEDSKKWGNSGENITFSESGQELCIDGMALPTVNDTINFHFFNMIAKTNYQLKLNGSIFNGNGMNAFVKDKYLNTATKVSSDSTIVNFTTSTDSATYFNRFSIYFAPYILPVSNINLTVTENNEQHVALNWNAPSVNNISSFTIQRSNNGKDFVNLETVGSSITSYTDFTSLSGKVYYRIRAINYNDEVSYSEAVSILISTIKNNLNVYPNPVVGSSFNIELNHANIGKYSIQLFNNLGQKIISQEYYHIGGKLVKKILTDKLCAGIYTLNIINSNGDTYQTSISFK